MKPMILDAKRNKKPRLESKYYVTIPHQVTKLNFHFIKSTLQKHRINRTTINTRNLSKQFTEQSRWNDDPRRKLLTFTITPPSQSSSPRILSSSRLTYPENPYHLWKSRNINPRETFKIL